VGTEGVFILKPDPEIWESSLSRLRKATRLSSPKSYVAASPAQGAPKRSDGVVVLVLEARWHQLDRV
jgi:hypothetical protein